ncbi:MAG: oxygen-insensitive NADPH nitroreductase [Saezia sp.]
MVSTIDLLTQHRSVRAFTEQPLSQEQKEEIIRAGQSASSSCFLQCSTIIQITDQALRAKLAGLSGNQPFIQQAAEFWVFCADFNRHLQIDPSIDLGFAEQLLLGTVDTAIMAQNVMAAAESLGLGGVYIGGLRNSLPQVTALLSIPEHVLPLFGMCLGYPAEQPELKPRLPSSVVVHENCYQPLDKAVLAEYARKMAAYYASRSGAKRLDTWSDRIAGQLNKEERHDMLDYLHRQGWIKK